MDKDMLHGSRMQYRPSSLSLSIYLSIRPDTRLPPAIQTHSSLQAKKELQGAWQALGST